MITKKKNLVYFGSPDFSANILQNLLKDKSLPFNITAIVTQPDQPSSRGQKMTPSPVAQLAQQHDLPVYKPKQLNSANLDHLKLLKPELFLVVAYGKILPQSWLDTPSLGTFNLHFSLLPKYRGGLCVSEAIKNGDSKTGVTLIQLDTHMDHGPIIGQIDQDIDINHNVTDLLTKLTSTGTSLLQQQLPLIASKKHSLTPQDHSKATHTPLTSTRTKKSAFIPWDTIKLSLKGKQSIKTHHLISSLNPQPGAWTKINIKQKEYIFKIIHSHIDQDKLIIDTIQLPSKQPTSWQAFLSGHPVPFS